LRIKSRKLFAIIVMTAMILTLLPVAGFAASDNRVDRVLNVEDGHSFTDPNTAPKLIIKEKGKSDFRDGDYFELSLTNAEWLSEAPVEAPVKIAVANEDTTVTVEAISPKLLGITIEKTKTAGEGDAEEDAEDIIVIPLLTKVKGEGEVKVTVDQRESGVNAGTYVFAISGAGATITTIDKVVTSGDRIKKLGNIRIDETRVGSLKYGEQKIILKLPPKFTWVSKGTPSGLVTYYDEVKGLDTRTLTLWVDLGDDRTARGSIFLKGLQIMADRDAPYGDVVIDVDGDNVTPEELLVAKHTDYGVNVSVKEVKDLVAGLWEQKTAKITIEEKIAKSLISGREIAVVLPEWVKIVGDDGKVSIKGDATEGVIGSRQNELYIEVEGKEEGKKLKYEFELQLSIEANKEGDIVAEFSGAGMEKQEVVIANAVAPITAEVAATDLKIGVQNQPAPDIVITETAKARIDDQYEHYDDYDDDVVDTVYELCVYLPKGIEFASTPDVEVTEGNLEIGKVKLANDKRTLVIPVDSSSTKPSTVKITNVKLTLDRTVPEGEFKAKIGGTAVVKNNDANATIKWPVEFATDNVVSFVFANVITPAPGETRATTTFTIGSTTYTVVENNVAVEKTMDVAPYIKEGRTYLPVRFVADALGVTEDNIIWDPVNATVTIFKGDRIAQMTIGSNILLVNGVQLTMDAVPEIVSGRTMLPVRWMAQALGATIEWDAETQQVTVTQ